MKSFVFTAIGADRPGLVEELSATVAGGGGNWLESRMAHFCGQFAGIVHVEVGDEGAPALRAALAAIEGLDIVVSEASEVCPAPGELVTLQLTGSDRPGIVSEISKVLAARGVNVEDLQTERVSAPMSGEPMFTARAELGLPEGVTPAHLQAALEGVAGDLMVDVTLA